MGIVQHCLVDNVEDNKGRGSLLASVRVLMPRKTGGTTHKIMYSRYTSIDHDFTRRTYNLADCIYQSCGPEKSQHR
jgi:CII-binding regulator of phage lambda lysogenization HflD